MTKNLSEANHRVKTAMTREAVKTFTALCQKLFFVFAVCTLNKFDHLNERFKNLESKRFLHGSDYSNSCHQPIYQMFSNTKYSSGIIKLCEVSGVSKFFKTNQDDRAESKTDLQDAESTTLSIQL